MSGSGRHTMKLPDDVTPRLSQAASTVAAGAAKHGRRSARETASLARLWFACFVAQGAYGLLSALVIGVAMLVAMNVTAGPNANVVDWVTEAIRDGEVSTSTLWYTVLILVGIGALGLLGTLVVPLFIQGMVRLTCRARVGYAWALVANLASWIGVTALSVLLWLLPGAQPFVAFAVWLGSSALCGLLLRARLTHPTQPVIDVSSPDQIGRSVDDAPHQESRNG